MKDTGTWWHIMICCCILDRLISLNPLSTIYILKLRKNGGIGVLPTELNGTYFSFFNLTFIKIDKGIFTFLQQISECQICVPSLESSYDMPGLNHAPSEPSSFG